jgi:hypothetical protein
MPVPIADHGLIATLCKLDVQKSYLKEEGQCHARTF